MDHDEFNVVYLQLLLSEFFCWLRCNRLWRFTLVYSKIILLIRQSQLFARLESRAVVSEADIGLLPHPRWSAL